MYDFILAAVGAGKFSNGGRVPASAAQGYEVDRRPSKGCGKAVVADQFQPILGYHLGRPLFSSGFLMAEQKMMMMMRFLELPSDQAKYVSHYVTLLLFLVTIEYNNIISRQNIMYLISTCQGFLLYKIAFLFKTKNSVSALYH